MVNGGVEMIYCGVCAAESRRRCGPFAAHLGLQLEPHHHHIVERTLRCCMQCPLALWRWWEGLVRVWNGSEGLDRLLAPNSHWDRDNVRHR